MKKQKKQGVTVFESESEASNLSRLEQLLEKAPSKLVVVGFDGEEVYLPGSIYQILRQVTPLLAQGKGVTLVPHEQYLTTQEAANILNVSRPFLYTLLDQEKIPYTKIGSHRRIKAEDLFNYKHNRDSQRRHALTELIEYSQDLGFYEIEKE